MNILTQRTFLSASIALALTACGGGIGGIAGVGDIAGIGGSGYLSSGSVTGFGSIFVNGVEFSTNAATFTIEGVPGSQADLIRGMRVTVTGTANADGVTGTATQVVFDDQLEGPIIGVPTEDVDQANKTFTVLGVTVTVSAADTVFLSTANRIDYSNLSQNDTVQISGFYDSAGVLHATAIVDKGVFVANDTVEATGLISALNGSTFILTIGGSSLSIDASTADVSQISGGLANGQVVEVKGPLIAATATALSATLIKLEDNLLTNGVEIELEGVVTRFVSISDFDVDGHPVDAATAVRTPTAFNMRNDLRVEVEGTVTNGVLQAEKLILRSGEVKIHAPASNIDAINGTFDLTIAGQTISVSVDTSTRLEDKADAETIAQALQNLDGQFLRVRGIADPDNGGVKAIRVRIRQSADDIILEGVLESQIQGASVTVLGITMAVDASTEFLDVNNAALADQAAFIANVTDGTTLIKIKDKKAGGGNAVDTADSVEIQPLF